MINWKFWRRRKAPLPAPEPEIVRYVLRANDGVQIGVPPVLGPTSPDSYMREFRWRKGWDDEGPLLIAVCDFCGGNCGQCGTSIGRGVPATMQQMVQSLHSQGKPK